MENWTLPKQLYLFLLGVFLLPGFGQCQPPDMNWFLSSMRDKAGNVWFATPSQGVFRYDAATSAFSNFSMANGLCSNNVSSVYEDKAGNLWFATEDGVCRYDGKTFTGITTENGLCHKSVTSIVEDNSGNFWFGTNGYGVCRYNPATGTFTHFTKADGLGSDAVQCILKDKAGNLWFGERDGGVSRFDVAKGKIAKVSGGCFSSQIMAIKEDRAGNIWFVNLYDGLCRYNPVSGEYTHFTEKDGLCGDVITCLYEDSKGNLWFSSGKNTPGIVRSEPKGLCRYDGKSFTEFTAKDGLQNLNVWTIAEDSNANIWVGTKGNLYRFHSPSGKFTDQTYKMSK